MSSRTYQIDPAHSGIHFSIRHLVIAKVRGAFTRFTGTIALDEADVTRSTVQVDIDAASIDTREAKRDEHLRSPDFLDVAQFPSIAFVSREVRARDGKVTEVVGDLSIHGVTRPVTLAVDDVGRARDPWGNERAAFSARARIDRRDFGLTWNAVLEAGGVLVGDHLDVVLDVEAIAQAAIARAS